MNEPTIYGLDQGTFLPQPDFSAWQSETGAWLAQQTFLCREASLGDDAFRNKFAPGKSPVDLDSSLDTYWDGLGLSRVNWRLRPGGWAEITVHYAGFAASGTGGPAAEAPIYELTVDTARISILEHPDIIALADGDRAYLDRVWRGEYTFDGTNWVDQYDFNVNAPTAGDTTTYAKLIAGGRKYFSMKTLVWTKRWSDDSAFTSSDVDKIGEIETPAGSPPAPTGTRTWIVSDLYQRNEGKLYRKVKSWTCSVEGGWNSTIYTI